MVTKFVTDKPVTCPLIRCHQVSTLTPHLTNTL